MWFQTSTAHIFSFSLDLKPTFRFELTFDIRITPTTDIVQFEKTIRCFFLTGAWSQKSSTCSCFQAVDGGGRVWLGTGVHPEVHRPDPHVNRYLSRIHKYTNIQIQSSPTLTSTGLPSKAHNFHRSKLSFRQRPMILGTLL